MSFVTAVEYPPQLHDVGPPGNMRDCCVCKKGGEWGGGGGSRSMEDIHTLSSELAVRRSCM